MVTTKLPRIDGFDWTAKPVRPAMAWNDREYLLVVADRGRPVYLVGRLHTSYADEWVLSRASDADNRTLAVDAMADQVATLPGCAAPDARAAYEAMRGE